MWWWSPRHMDAQTLSLAQCLFWMEVRVLRYDGFLGKIRVANPEKAED